MDSGRELAERAIAPRVGAVIIGRNEGERLVECLHSVTAQVPNAVYVDSGSSDGSPARARAIGVRVIELTSGPYRAARGRQVGMDELLSAATQIEFVQFIDGDCILQPGWLAAALTHLDANTDVAAVAGRRREERTDHSFYSRLIDIDWDIPAGTALYFGGDSLCRIDSIRDVGGWPTDLIAGEEPDLGFRLIDAGAKIERLPVEMTRHDIRMSRFGEYWKRAVRTGHAYAEVGWRRRRGIGVVWLRRAASVVAYGAILPLLTIIGMLFAWPLALLAVLLYARLTIVVAWRCRRRGYPGSLSVIYSCLNAVGKIAGAMGVARYLTDRLLQKRPELIEYRKPPNDAAPLVAQTTASEASVAGSGG